MPDAGILDVEDAVSGSGQPGCDLLVCLPEGFPLDAREEDEVAADHGKEPGAHMLEAPRRAAPPLSVVMPVRNAMPYLRESMASILDQSHAQFEFVIVDDGSTDGSSEFLRDQAQRDGRIRLHRLERGVGVVVAANRTVALSSAPLVARMDADDVCEPDRLERQLDVLARTSDAVVVGALADGIDVTGRRVR